MLCIPVQNGPSTYVIFMCLMDETIQRIKDYDPADIDFSNLPEPWRNMRCTGIMLGYSTVEDFERVKTLAASGHGREVFEYLSRGKKFIGDKDASGVVRDAHEVTLATNATVDVPDEVMLTLGLRREPGWNAAFTRNQAEGALPNGTRITKAVDEPADRHRIGDMGTVLGSIAHPAIGNGYFIEWDDLPRTPVFVTGAKIAPAGEVAA